MTTDNTAPASEIAEENAPPASDIAETAPETAKGSRQMIPKARLDQEIGKRRVLEEDVKTMADAMLANVPEKLRALIPDDLSPAAKAAWYLRARETGVFETGVFESGAFVPATDTGKPKTTPTETDPSTLPPRERIASGYKPMR